MNLLKSIPTYSCPEERAEPLAPHSPPQPPNHPPALGRETDRAKLGALISPIAFRGRFLGTRSRTGLGITPRKQRGVALLAFYF